MGEAAARASVESIESFLERSLSRAEQFDDLLHSYMKELRDELYAQRLARDPVVAERFEASTGDIDEADVLTHDEYREKYLTNSR